MHPADAQDRRWWLPLIVALLLTSAALRWAGRPGYAAATAGLLVVVVLSPAVAALVSIMRDGGNRWLGPDDEDD